MKSDDEERVFWLPEVYVFTVILTASRRSSETAIRFLPDTWPGRVETRRTGCGLHVVVSDQGCEHRLFVDGPPPLGTPLALHVPADEGADLRAEASRRFLRYVAHGEIEPEPELTEARLARLFESLRAFDAKRAGATYRKITEVFFGRERTANEDMKTSSLQKRVVRLVERGETLVDGGYRELLKGQWPHD